MPVTLRDARPEEAITILIVMQAAFAVMAVADNEPLPVFRKKGIGSKLLDYVERLARFQIRGAYVRAFCR